jgi:hypothetical protein
MARLPQELVAEVPMEKTLDVVWSRDLPRLFAFFGVDAAPERVELHRTAIQKRFAAEVREIVHICSKVPEQERFKLFREALRLSYESALLLDERAA